MAKPIPLDLNRYATLIEDSREFLRMWARPDGVTACFVNPVPIGPDPAALGAVLVDAVRQGAKAYARAVNIDETEALARIWEGFEAERLRPTDDPLQIVKRS